MRSSSSFRACFSRSLFDFFRGVSIELLRVEGAYLPIHPNFTCDAGREHDKPRGEGQPKPPSREANAQRLNNQEAVALGPCCHYVAFPRAQAPDEDIVTRPSLPMPCGSFLAS
jgi:hypothetical protein